MQSSSSIEKPLLIFDGECAFCRRAVARLKRSTCGNVRFRPYQEAASDFPEIRLQAFESAVCLVEPERRRSFGAEAIFRALSYAPPPHRAQRCLLWLYLQSRVFRFFADHVYRWVASHRMLASRLLQRLRII